VPTDPNFDRKHTQAKPAHPAQKKKSAAHNQRNGAAVSLKADNLYREERRGEKRIDHAQSSKGGYSAKTDAHKSREKDARKQTASAAKKPVRETYDARYGAQAMPKKKKKKFKLKRFFKKIGKELAAFGTKLVEVEEIPVQEPAFDADITAGDLGFAQSKPLFDTSRAKAPGKGNSDSKQMVESVWGGVKKALRSALRVVARGIYLGIRRVYAFLMKLPQRTLLIGSGAFGLVLITVVVLAFALPGKPSRAEEGEQLAAFTALESEESALDNTTLETDGTDTTNETDGTLPTDVDSAIEGVVEEHPQTDGTTPVFTGEVKSGDDGAIITTIQSRLMELGYMDSDEPTEHFGPLTQSALKSFQRHNGLGDDGICGQATYDMLMNAEAKVYVMQLGDTGPDVEGVQQRLYELGYLDNKANIQGTFGEKTEAAAKEFQKKNDLTADGKVGNRTLEMLYGEDVVGNAFTLGDENQVIEDCQAALKKLGYITFKPDGVMGKATVSAIKAFQQKNGLTRDGALGPVTRDMILSGEAQEMVMQLGDYGTDVKNMQARLAKLNYLSSANATGYFGEITADAVKAFQKRAGLTADGKVGGVTLTMMNSSSAKKASSPPSTKKENKTSGNSSSGGSSGGSSGSSSNVSNLAGVEKLVALAESKIGSKYVRGAKGPNSFDCSGFVYWCLKNSGVSTSYMTSIAWRNNSRFSRSTSMSGIQRGDILVFSGESDSTGHVGIYLGGGKMVDASSSEGQVRQSSSVLNSGGYWSRHFICSYRVF
jgi:peptidoglycan hydrolase-like protein with peptidoglycan-binding domain